jgi:ABC-type antimicrobial peptide transport system permease subunit
MTATTFEILMVIALGSLAGTILGLGIGFITGNQKSPWSLLIPREKSINILLVVLCSVICVAALAWYSLLVATSV